MAHPADLAAQPVETRLDVGALLRGEAAIVVMHLPHPLADAGELAAGARALAAIEAAIGDAAIDAILQELDALARAVGRTAPEGVGVPATRRTRSAYPSGLSGSAGAASGRSSAIKAPAIAK